MGHVLHMRGTRLLFLKPGSLLMIFLITSLGFYVVYPLALILINSFNEALVTEAPRYGFQAWHSAYGNPLIWESLWNSVVVMFIRQATTFPLGVLLAWILARTNVPFSKGFEFLFWVSFMVPSTATAFAWIVFTDPDTGLINLWSQELLGKSFFNIYSFWGIVWVHFISGLDTKVILLTPAFRQMDATMEEASRMSGAGTIGTMFRVTLPIMTPALLLVLLLSVVRLLESFEIEFLLGIPWGFYVYSTMIVDLARTEPPLLNQAAALGSIVLLFLAVFIPFQQWVISRKHYVTVTGKIKPKVIDVGRWRYLLTVVLTLVVILAVGVPILGALGSSLMVRFGFFDLPQVWTLEYWLRVLNDPRFLRSLGNTLIIAGTSAVIGSFLLGIVAYVIVRTELPWRRVLDAICWFPSAIPGVLAGLGFMWMFLGLPLFRPIYGTLFLLIIAAMMSGFTLSSQILKANFIQLGSELEEAARMSGAGQIRTFVQVVIPLIAPTMVLVAVLKFLFAARNASSIILLSTSETAPLSILALEQIMAGQREEASVTVFMIILLTVGVAIAARSFGLRLGLRQE